MQLQSTSRRLPIYLLIDVSGSMSGAPIDAVNAGLRDFETALKSDPHALESAYVSILTFESSSQQIVPLSEAGCFSAPSLQTGGGTSLGSALRLLGECLDRDIQEKGPQHPGDWKPMVFLMTDGEPTDKWRPELAALKGRHQRRPTNLMAIGCGPQANVAVLKEISEMVLLMPDLSPEKFRTLFQWISQSVKVASKAASQQAVGSTGGAQLPPAPPGFQIAL
jgi:uncharacterized protein YegL